MICNKTREMLKPSVGPAVLSRYKRKKMWALFGKNLPRVSSKCNPSEEVLRNIYYHLKLLCLVLHSVEIGSFLLKTNQRQLSRENILLIMKTVKNGTH